MENQPPLSITGINTLDANPMFLMGFAYKQFRSEITSKLLANAGISLEMYGGLKVLNERGKMTQQQLSDLLLRNRSVTKRLVDNAIKLGLISASKSDTNKKIKLLTLTAQGQQTVVNCAPIVEHGTQQFLAALTNGEEQQLATLLAKLVKTDQLVD